MTMQEVLKEIITDVIHKKLKKEGFKKQGKNFYKSLNELEWCLDVQSDKWNTKEHVEFTLNAGIFIPFIYELDINFKQLPSFPKEIDCTIRQRISELRRLGTDTWYVLNKDTSVEQLKHEIDNHIELYILPFFNRFVDLKCVISEWEKDEKLFSDFDYAALLAKSGKLNHAKDIFLGIHNNTEFGFARARTRRVASLFGIDIPRLGKK